MHSVIEATPTTVRVVEIHTTDPVEAIVRDRARQAREYIEEHGWIKGNYALDPGDEDCLPYYQTDGYEVHIGSVCSMGGIFGSDQSPIDECGMWGTNAYWKNLHPWMAYRNKAIRAEVVRRMANVIAQNTDYDTSWALDKKSNEGIVQGYNDDDKTTFSDVIAVFRAVELGMGR